MNCYIYQGGLYCEDCGQDIRKRLKQGLDSYVDVANESSYDSDDYPKGPLPNGGGESDIPQHCDSGDDCLNGIILQDGRKVGCFLENPLTADGYHFLNSCDSEVADIWKEFYEC